MTEQRAETVSWSNLPTRIGSALVIALVVGVCLWFGGWVWVAAVGLMGARMLFEWMRMSGSASLVWKAIGVAYVALPLAAMVGLRGGDVGLDAEGFRLAAFIILVVIAADAGAYFSGKSIGGPKLIPRLSPKKTWTGLGGGLALGGVVGGLLAELWRDDVYKGVTVGFALVVAAVAGDFLESGFKRHFGVKDTGSILPGHGGVLDRADSHMAAFAVAALALWIAPALSPV